MSQNPINIVSGLPRSGTSMMMKVLEAGGLEVLTDNIRSADQDNPRGYFEYEVVKDLGKNKEWLRSADGKVVKVISHLLKELPQGYTYKVIFMRRKMQEILASQRQMLIRRGEPTDKVSDAEMAPMFEKHLVEIESWLENQDNFEVLYVSYNEMLKEPNGKIERINRLLGGCLNTDNLVKVIDTSLYRQRA